MECRVCTELGWDTGIGEHVSNMIEIFPEAVRLNAREYPERLWKRVIPESEMIVVVFSNSKEIIVVGHC